MKPGDYVKIKTEKGGQGTVIEISKHGIVTVLDTDNQWRYIFEEDLQKEENG